MKTRGAESNKKGGQICKRDSEFSLLRPKFSRRLILLHGNRHHADNSEQRHFIRFDLDNVGEKRTLYKLLWNTNLYCVALLLPTFLTLEVTLALL